jgi:hypothetical protein
VNGPSTSIEVPKGVYIYETLAMALQGTDLADEEKFKLVHKPPRMIDGAVFSFERVFLTARVALAVQIWDGSSRRCGIEIAPTATIGEIVEKAQYRLDDEPLEEARWYSMYFKNQPSHPP